METKELTALRISLASPETIMSWSYGEVLKPETINYRRLRPEKDGLFCEAIFGPSRDWQCYCGKYKNIRYKGIVCDKCGVEVTRSAVRRERMGHITLATPVAHVWYTRRVPSHMGTLLDISRRNLDRVLYFAQYMVTYVDEDARQKALTRLEEDIADEGRSIAAHINARIAAVNSERDHAIEQLNIRKETIEQEYDERIAANLEPAIKEGQRLERELSEKLDKTIRKPIVFQVADSDAQMIADAGEVIGNQHLSKVQEIVKSHLDSIDSDLREEKQRELENLKMLRLQEEAEAEQSIEELRNQMEDQVLASRTEKKKLRDELIDLRPITFLSEHQYREVKSRWGQVFRADMGAEAFYDVLKRIDLDKLVEELWTEVRTTKSKQRRKKATKRLKIAEALRRSNNRPEWMILTVLPVIPPDLRPMVQLDGGRFATSDLNDLYRRVINRNNRLKRLLELGAPDVIVRNEKRMLQEAVDSLIDNSQRGKALSRRGRRELKSLSDMLKGKKGRFRRNLLGKRVDYSGRSVIVVGPKLKLHQCGLPKSMALELFRPFVISRLVAHNYATNVKGAKRFVERNRPEVWEVLEEVIKDRPVMLNRAPTLHRLGIQAFEVVLVEGSAIHLHPLVCTAFNADFDGDQMAVHVPLSEKAVAEARRLMLASKNLLKPADGEPIIGPSKDMVLGVYYMTIENEHARNAEDRIFDTLDEVELVYEMGQLDIHSPIRYLTQTWFDDHGNRLAESETRVITTTVGRVIFNSILPEKIQFINHVLEKGGVKDLIALSYDLCGEEITMHLADDIKDMGFKFATRSGVSIAVSDITVPESKPKFVKEALDTEIAIQRDFRRGLLTEQEQNERIIEVWQNTTETISNAVREKLDPNGNLATMANSGATKGGFGPISQLAGMRGLMADPSGRIIPLPIRSNFREGLTALEYFISTHGARKGLADTALRTADAGYLTRRLVDVAQDVIVNEEDCGTENGIYISSDDNVPGQTVGTRIYGRLTAERVVHPQTGEILAERNQLLDREVTNSIVLAGLNSVKVRSPLTCELSLGICAKCYGLDLGRGKMVEIGSAMGIVAAQSIGEPGTQLTLRTFHAGGVAVGGDITTGLPRVEELFEARKTPKGEAVVTEIAGVVHVEQSDRYSDLRVVRVKHAEMIEDQYVLPEGWQIVVEDGSEISAGDVLASLEDNTLTAQNAGKVRIEDDKIIIAYEHREEEEYEIPSSAHLLVSTNDHVEAGQALTEGSLNPHLILKIQGDEACQKYLLSEVQKVYSSQGQNIHDKHFETIIRKMLSRVQITRPGDSGFLPGEMVNSLDIKQVNEKLLADGKQPAKYINILLGITKASLSTDSFLAASSFQHTIKVLAAAAVAGKVDPLLGLKENVIIGKLIPAGSGFEKERFDAALRATRIAEGNDDLVVPVDDSLDENLESVDLEEVKEDGK